MFVLSMKKNSTYICDYTLYLLLYIHVHGWQHTYKTITITNASIRVIYYIYYYIAFVIHINVNRYYVCTHTEMRCTCVFMYALTHAKYILNEFRKLVLSMYVIVVDVHEQFHRQVTRDEKNCIFKISQY